MIMHKRISANTVPSLGNYVRFDAQSVNNVYGVTDFHFIHLLSSEPTSPYIHHNIILLSHSRSSKKTLSFMFPHQNSVQVSCISHKNNTVSDDDNSI
jgi:hypothetical protein